MLKLCLDLSFSDWAKLCCIEAVLHVMHLHLNRMCITTIFYGVLQIIQDPMALILHSSLLQ